MGFLVQFFQPYFMFLLGAAYNLQQSIDGMRIWSASTVANDASGNFVSSFGPSVPLVGVLGLLLLYTVLFLLPMMWVAGYVVNRRRGVIRVCLMLVMPGVLGLLGLLPSINYIPRSYVIHGTGVLGSPVGMLPLVIFGMLTGWALVVIASDAFRWGEKFRSTYDHMWYATAVFAGIFFVADLDATRNEQNLREENQNSRQASAYLLNQVRNYDLYCQRTKTGSGASCTWATYVQQTLNDYVVSEDSLFHLTGPKSSVAMYDPLRRGISEQDILKIREELKKYNETICPIQELGNGAFQSTLSGTCLRTPPPYCRTFPEPFKGHVNEASLALSTAIDSECIIPGLIHSRLQQEKLSAAVAQDKINKHYRWLFYILFSVVAGGKIANATAKILGLGDKRDERYSIDLANLLFRRIASICRAVLKSFSAGFVFIFTGLVNLFRRLAKRLASWKGSRS